MSKTKQTLCSSDRTSKGVFFRRKLPVKHKNSLLMCSILHAK